MKSLFITLMICAATVCIAAPNITVTNWIPNYVSILTSTDTGDTGLGVSTNYICFNIADLALLTTNQADMASGDIRRIQYALLQDWFTKYDDSTNAPAFGTIDEGSSSSDNTNATIFMSYKLKVWLDLTTGTVTIPDE